MVDESIIETVKRYLNHLRSQGFDARFGVLFGSHVTGDTHKYSDIDLMVVSPQFDPPRDRRDRIFLWTSVLPIDINIEPIPCGLKQWEEDDETPIIEVARREGIIIKAEESLAAFE